MNTTQQTYDYVIDQALRRYEKAVQYYEDREGSSLQPTLGLKLADFELKHAMVIATHR